MQVSCETKETSLLGDCLVVGVFAGEVAAALQDVGFAEARDAFLDSNDFRGKLGDVSVLYRFDSGKTRRILLLGLGDSAKYDVLALRKALGHAVNKVRDMRRQEVSVFIDSFLRPHHEICCEAARVVDGIVYANYEYVRFKTDESERKVSISSVNILSKLASDRKRLQRAMDPRESLARPSTLHAICKIIQEIG